MNLSNQVSPLLTSIKDYLFCCF